MRKAVANNHKFIDISVGIGAPPKSDTFSVVLALPDGIKARKSDI